MGKISYECRVYESVDDSNLSICRKLIDGKNNSGHEETNFSINSMEKLVSVNR